MESFAVEQETSTTNIPEKVMMNDSKNIIYLLFIMLIEYMFRKFILTPVSIITKYSCHPISIFVMFLFLSPFYIFTKCVICAAKYIGKIALLPKNQQYIFILNVFFGNLNNRNDWITRESRRHHLNNEDEMQQWVERCSICFESKLDLCLDFCRDQFCLECFQKYVFYQNDLIHKDN